MADGITPILSFLGWAFVPGWATSIAQSIYYKLTVPVGRAPPQPGTAIFAKHYRRIRILVLTLYLAYTFLQSLHDIKLAGDFFTLLSVTPSSPDREIRSRFRRLAAKYHPDKVNSTPFNAEDVNTSADAHFLVLKTAQDTLINPTLRFAYMRYGPSIVQVNLASLKPSIGTYVYAGLKNILLPSYIMNVATLTVLNYFFLPKWGTYWRYYALTFIFAIELFFLTHSNPSLTHLVPSFVARPLAPLSGIYAFLQARTKLNQLLPSHLLPYQTLAVLRNLSISLNIFISQLAPPNAAATEAPAKTQIAGLLNGINQSLSHLSVTTKRADQESAALLALQLAPFRDHPAQADRLREAMKEGAVRGALLAQEDVRTALSNAQARRKGQRTSNSLPVTEDQ